MHEKIRGFFSFTQLCPVLLNSQIPVSRSDSPCVFHVLIPLIVIYSPITMLLCIIGSTMSWSFVTHLRVSLEQEFIFALHLLVIYLDKSIFML